MLRARHDRHRYAFINAGQNGNSSRDLLRRLSEIVSCEPDAVTVLIGTNDARTGFPETAERFFQQSLSALMSGLRSQTIARIALLSIPPLGAVITAEINPGVGTAATPSFAELPTRATQIICPWESP
jgi:lysophospholipase L1-like esterase